MARQLNTLTQLRRYLTDVINRTDAGKLDPTVAGRLAYMVNIQKSLIVESDLEIRLCAVEEKLK